MAVDQIAIGFHGIGQSEREFEPGEERYWISRDSFLHFLDIVARLPDPGRVVLTFDDGNVSDHDIALPALRDRGLGCSFFVPTCRIDGRGSLSASQLRTLGDAGMVVGSHGVDHVDWRKIAPGRLRDELESSKQTLAAILGHEVSTTSIPFGRYDRRVLAALRAAGYRKAYSTDGGTSCPESFLIGRTNIRADTTPADFVQLVTSRETRIAGFVRQLKFLRRKFT